MKAPSPRRVLSRAGKALLVLLILLAFGVALLHLPFAQREVAELLSRRASRAIDGRVDIGDLDYRLWRGEVIAERIIVESESVIPDWSLTARVRRVEVSLGNPFTFAVRVESPDVTLRARSGPQPEPRSGTGDLTEEVVEPRLPGWLQALETSDGRVRVEWDGDELEVAPIDLELESSPEGYRGSLDVGGGDLVFREARFVLHRAEVVASGESDGMRVPRAIVELEGARAEAEGVVERLRPLTSRFEVDVLVEARLAGKFPTVPPMSGNLSSHLSLAFAADDVVVSGNLEARGLAVGDVGPVDVRTALRVEEELLALDRLHVEGYRGSIDGSAQLALFSGGRQSVAIDFEHLALEAILEKLTGQAPVSSSMSGSMRADVEDWDWATLEGEADVRLDPPAEDGRRALRPVSGSISASADAGVVDFRASRLEVGAATARLEGSLSADGFHAGFRVQDLDLAALETALPGALASRVGGRLGLEGNVSGDGFALQELTAETRFLPSSSLEVDDRLFDLRGRVTLENGRVDLAEIGLESRDGTGRVAVGGWYELPSRRVNVTLEGEELHASFAPWATLVERVELIVSGSLPHPAGSLALELAELSYRDRELPAVSVHARSDGETVTSSVRDHDGEFLTTELGLRPPYPLTARIDLERAPLPSLLSIVSEGEDPSPRLAASGEVTATAELVSPWSFSFRGSVSQLDAELGGIEMRAAAPFTFAGDSSKAVVEGLSLTGSGGRTDLEVDGTFAFSRDVRHALTLDGVLAVEQLEPLLRDTQLDGILELDVSLEGLPSSPNLTGHASLEDGSVARDPLDVRDVDLVLEARGDRVALERLQGVLFGGSVEATGSLTLGSDEDGFGAPVGELRVAARDLELAPVLGIENVDDLSLLVSASAEIDLTGLDLRSLEGSGSISKVVTRFGTTEVRATPASFDLRNGRLEVPSLRLDGETFDLVTAAEVVLSPELQWSVTARGGADLAMANAFLNDASVAGPVRLDLAASSRPEPEGFHLAGSAEVNGATLTFVEPPLAVTDVEARVDLDSSRVVLDRLSGRLGGGTVRAEGHYDLSPSSEAAQRVSVQATATDIRVEYPEGLKSTTSADLRFQSLPSPEGRYRLSGDIRLREALYDRDITVERQLLTLLSRESEVATGSPSFAENVTLDVHVENEGDLRVQNNLANATIRVDLDVAGTLAAPEIRGSIATRTGGTITFAGRSYELDVARVTLDGYPLTPPILDVSAHTEVGGTPIELEVTGRTDELSTNLRAPEDPSLSRNDVASLLLTGRTVEEARGEEVAALGEGLASYLGGSLAGLTEVGLGQALPVSRVSVQPELVGRETDPGARFSLGQAVTEDILLTYSIGLNSAEDQLWIVDYTLPWRLTARAIRDGDNEYTASLSQELFFGRDEDETTEEPVGRPEVKTTTLRGELPLPREKLREEIPLEPGDAFEYWDARRGADDIRSRLRENGYLSARVDVRTIPEEPQGSEEVEVVYEVDAGKPVTLSFAGDDPGSEIRNRIRQRWNGLLPPTTLARELAQEATWLLRSDGYYRADVTSRVEETEAEDRIAVVFSVDRGRRGELTLRFDGNEAVPDRELQRALPSASSPAFHEQLFASPEELRERLHLLYTARGFADAEIDGPAASFSDSPSGPELEVVFRIDEGQAQQVTSLRFEGISSLSESEVRESLSLREGERFGLDRYLESRRTLHAIYRREGFPEASVRGRIRRVDEGIAVDFFVAEGPRVRVGDVIIRGADRGKAAFIREELTFSSGEPLRLGELSVSERRLYDLERFRFVDVRVSPDEDAADGTRSVIVEVRDKPRVLVDYGLRFSTDEALEGSLDLRFPGLLGSSRSLQFTAFANARNQILRLNVNSPRFFGRDIDSTLFVSRKDEETTASDSRSWSVTYQQGRQIGSSLRAQWSYSFRRVHTVGNVMTGPFAFDVTTKRSILSASLIQDTRNDVTRPTRGRFWNGTIQFAPEELGSDLRVLKGFGQVFYFKSLRDGIVWASSYRLGLATGFDQVLREQDRFQAGGPNSVRGFELDQLGPVDPRIGARIGGEALLVLNQELRFPIWNRVRGVAFLDAGNVYLEVSDFDLTDIRESVGLGARVQLPVGLLRVDWAYVLDPRPGDDRYRFHFSFGHAF